MCLLCVQLHRAVRDRAYATANAIGVHRVIYAHDKHALYSLAEAHQLRAVVLDQLALADEFIRMVLFTRQAAANDAGMPAPSAA